MTKPESTIISVDDLGRKISELVASIGDIAIEGRIVNVNASDSGWYNFRIASEDNNFVEVRAKMGTINEPVEGEHVLVRGRPHIYRRRNVVQISVYSIERMTCTE